jgi:hypothetical protein
MDYQGELQCIPQSVSLSGINPDLFQQNQGEEDI